MVRGRDKFKKFKKAIVFVEKCYGILPKKIQKRLLIYHRKTNGNIGLVIRYALLRNLALYVGENVSIHPDVYLFNIDNLSIGNNVSIHPMTYIEAWGGVTIGNDVSIAHATTILSVNHGFEKLGINIKDQELIPMPVTISDNVWVGSKAVILGGMTISTGSIIGAGAVVTKDVKKNAIVVGVPAKTKKIRKEL